MLWEPKRSGNELYSNGGVREGFPEAVGVRQELKGQGFHQREKEARIFKARETA